MKRSLARNLPLLTFLGAYFATTVFANLVYPVLGKGESTIIDARALSEFSTAGTFGYWLLLFLPFLVAPPIALGARALFRRQIQRVADFLPDFAKRDYVILLTLSYCYVTHAFWQADAFQLMTHATTATSTAIRFDILAAVGFWPQVILKSVLMFLAIYSFAEAFRSAAPFWRWLAALNLVTMSVLLLWLNMKWPILILYVAAALCVILFSRIRFQFVFVGAGLILFIAYVGVSVIIMRAAPEVKIVRLSGTLLVAALDRIAVGYPYYYQTFTTEGQVCGTLVDRILRKTNPCQPSNLIYTKVFGRDEFKGASTQPAGVNIYGYALGGWPGAVLELVIASVVIGVFMSLRFERAASSTQQSMIVMGGLAGYHFSQLPVEAAFIYDHGLLWWASAVFGYALLQSLLTKLSIYKRSLPK